MSLTSTIESILFVASRPLTIKKIAKIVNASVQEVEKVLNELAARYNNEAGVVLMHTHDEWQLVSNPTNVAVTEQMVKAEISDELTRPQLETLTVISYCSPITKPELEQIRGVNCSLILRNLLMRGLIRESDDLAQVLPAYEVTIDYLRHLGIQSVTELPEYQELHRHEYITKTLETSNEE